MSISKDTRIIDLTVGQWKALQSEELEEMREIVKLLKISVDKNTRPMTIREASEFLGVTRATFHKYRHLVKDVGTPGSPRFMPSDLLTLKTQFRDKAA